MLIKDVLLAIWMIGAIVAIGYAIRTRELFRKDGLAVLITCLGWPLVLLMAYLVTPNKEELARNHVPRTEEKPAPDEEPQWHSPLDCYG